jgi:hypothetical protein
MHSLEVTGSCLLAAKLHDVGSKFCPTLLFMKRFHMGELHLYRYSSFRFANSPYLVFSRLISKISGCSSAFHSMLKLHHEASYHLIPSSPIAVVSDRLLHAHSCQPTSYPIGTSSYFSSCSHAAHFCVTEAFAPTSASCPTFAQGT